MLTLGFLPLICCTFLFFSCSCWAAARTCTGHAGALQPNLTPTGCSPSARSQPQPQPSAVTISLNLLKQTPHTPALMPLFWQADAPNSLCTPAHKPWQPAAQMGFPMALLMDCTPGCASHPARELGPTALSPSAHLHARLSLLYPGGMFPACLATVDQLWPGLSCELLSHPVAATNLYRASPTSTEFTF